MIQDLIKKNRTYRRFYQEVEIDRTVLEELIDLARLSSSGGNLQSLKYVLSNEPEKNNLIFQHLKWAGYLKEWNGPEEVEKLDIVIKQAIWLQTKEGIEWEDDEDDEKHYNNLAICENDIIEYIISDFVLSTASNYTNSRIEKYIWG